MSRINAKDEFADTLKFSVGLEDESRIAFLCEKAPDAVY